MNNQEIWERFLLNNYKWREAEHSGEKIELTYFQLKSVVDTAAKYARMDEKEEAERQKAVEDKLREVVDSGNKNKENANFNDIFGQMFGGGFGKK